MGRVKHKNLVQLIGYCCKKELLLVYEYMPNGSLDKFLFTNEKPILSWPQRFQILKDIASALLYLHEGCPQVILHRDVKASNVMLDAAMNGRLGDFGLARFYDHGGDPQTTNVSGSPGYLAPEIPRTELPTTSGDVFAFGAFILEVACGRRPLEPPTTAEQPVLTDWVSKCLEGGGILEVCDPKLESNYDVEEMEMVLQLGLLCCNSDPALRPCIREVMKCLSGDVDVPEAPPDCASIGMLSTGNDLIISGAPSLENASDHS